MRIKINKRMLVLVTLALCSGVVAAWMAQQYIQDRITAIEAQSRVETEPRVVAAYDLPVGTKIESAHVAVREIPKDWIVSGSLRPEEFIQIEGQIVTVALKRGDPILWANTATASRKPFSEKINVGRRAVTMPVDSINSVSGMLVPGDLIDLYVSFEYKQRQITAPLLQGVLVMATGKQSRYSDSGEETSFSTVTLDTAPEDAAKLVAARQAGTITALLRNPHDNQSSQKAIKGDLATILGIANPPPQIKRRPAIVYGDKPSAKLPALVSDKEKSEPQDKGVIDLPGQEDLVSAWIRSLPPVSQESLSSFGQTITQP